MILYKIDVLHPPKKITLGIQGEKTSRVFAIDWETVKKDFPNSFIDVVIKRPTETESYYTSSLFSTAPFNYIPTAKDLNLSGDDGELQIIIHNNVSILKSIIINFTVLPSLNGGGDVPEPLPYPELKTLEISDYYGDYQYNGITDDVSIDLYHPIREITEVTADGQSDSLIVNFPNSTYRYFIIDLIGVRDDIQNVILYARNQSIFGVSLEQMIPKSEISTDTAAKRMRITLDRTYGQFDCRYINSHSATFRSTTLQYSYRINNFDTFNTKTIGFTLQCDEGDQILTNTKMVVWGC